MEETTGKTLSNLLECARKSRCPDYENAISSVLEPEYRHLEQLLASEEVPIYGANTLTGHRDGLQISPQQQKSLQQSILSSHVIGGAPFLSDYAARCITQARLASWAAGGSGVSPDLFRDVSKAVSDPAFRPRIPARDSYSSGDVIPASHWLQDLLGYLGCDLGPLAGGGDIMASINGHFVQSGYALSLIPAVRHTYALFLENTALQLVLAKANGSNLYQRWPPPDPWLSDALSYLRQSVGKPALVLVQDPVSLRASPQLLRQWTLHAREWLSEVEQCLGEGAGNPLFDQAHDFGLSQGSFLAPVLSSRTEAVIETLLFSLWAVVGRTHHLLSGRVDSVPRDAATSATDLGLIQYPKLMMATMERARARFGRRLFSSGSQTSYGIEDLWSGGLEALGQLDELLQESQRLLLTETRVLRAVADRFRPEVLSASPLLQEIEPDQKADVLRQELTDGQFDNALVQPLSLFPVTISRGAGGGTA